MQWDCPPDLFEHFKRVLTYTFYPDFVTNDENITVSLSHPAFESDIYLSFLVHMPCLGSSKKFIDISQLHSLFPAVSKWLTYNELTRYYEAQSTEDIKAVLAYLLSNGFVMGNYRWILTEGILKYDPFTSTLSISSLDEKTNSCMPSHISSIITKLKSESPQINQPLTTNLSLA